jgi:hypothetical protein
VCDLRAVCTVTLIRPHSNKPPDPSVAECSIPFTNQTSETMLKAGLKGAVDGAVCRETHNRAGPTASYVANF